MSGRQIDTSQMSIQGWVITAQHFRPASVVSPASTNVLPSPATSPKASDARTGPSSLEGRLFDNRAELKMAVSEIVSHLDPKWRGIIFEQLDALLDKESWQDDSMLIEKSTFLTFLRFVVFAGPTRLPSIGVGPTGNLLAAWIKDGDRVAIEFRRDDMAAATFVWQGARSRESVAWRGHVVDLKLFLERNCMAQCIRDEPR
jgi:hypothetical protein